MQLDKLLKKIRGNDQRAAYRAIAQLREGTAGLARRWFTLGTAEQRHRLLLEIEQYLNEWASEGIVELAITALDEPDDKLRGYALLCVRAALKMEDTEKFCTPERRARIAQALVRAMARHEERPLGLFWRLRPFAGASRRTTVEKLDPENMPAPYPKRAADFSPGVPVPVARVWDRGTGLLEIKILEQALRQIRARKE